METRMYVCKYCKKEYTPKRRRVQKFCSNSCRVRSHQLKKTKPEEGLTKKDAKQLPEKISVDKMSMAGIGNATVGTLAANTLTNIFIREENKPLTKGDLKYLILKLEEIQEIIKKENELAFNNPFFKA